MTTQPPPTRQASPSERAKDEQRAQAKATPFDPEKLPPSLKGMSEQEIEMAKRTIAKDANTDELGFFFAFCKARDLDPWAKEVYFVKRVNDKGEVSLSFQTSIDGMRIASRKGDKIEWMDGPLWCGPDGAWLDVWLSDDLPKAARFIVKIKGQDKPIMGTALFAEYAQRTYRGDLTRMWENMPAGQIAKCAEALTLRRALPKELGGVHIDDEMQQADNPEKNAGSASTSTTPPPSRADALKEKLALPAATTTPAEKVPAAADRPLEPSPIMAANGITAADLQKATTSTPTSAPSTAPTPAPASSTSSPPEPTRTGASGGAEGPAMCDAVQATRIRESLDELGITGKEARAAYLGRVLAEVDEKAGKAKPNPIPPLEKLSTMTKVQAYGVTMAIRAEIDARIEAERTKAAAAAPTTPPPAEPPSDPPAEEREPGSDDDREEEDTGS